MGYTPYNHWVIMYPYGHSLALAPGVILGIPWIMPPLIGILFLLVMYYLLKEFFGKFLAFLITLIAFFSPQFQMHAVNFMSHNTAVLYMAFFLLTFLRIQQKHKEKLFLFLGGVSYCLLFQTRPLVAVVVSPVICIFLIILFLKKCLKPNQLFWLGLGFLLSLFIVLYTNFLIYGHPTKTVYSQMTFLKFTWAGSGLTLNHGLVDSLSYLLSLRLLIFPGLPNLLGLIIFLSFFNKKFFWLTTLCFGSTLLILIGTATYDDVWGIFLGARFWYEMLPFLFILLAISFDLVVQKIGKMGYLITSLVTLLIGFRSINGWVLVRQKLWENMIYFTPKNVKELKSFNFSDARLIKEAQRQKLNNALIFVKDCGGQWWCYGTVLNENTINFDGNIVWAQDLGNKNRELINIYPGRKVFIADYDRAVIEPYTANEN